MVNILLFLLLGCNQHLLLLIYVYQILVQLFFLFSLSIVSTVDTYYWLYIVSNADTINLSFNTSIGVMIYIFLL